MKRYVLREKDSGQFFKTDTTNVECALDAFIFTSDLVADLLLKTKAGFELCAAELDVASVKSVKVGEL